MKPATALPWSIVDDKEGPRTIILDAYRNEIAHDLPYEHFFNSDNAAYIVHCANNYPRLVQALKDLRRDEALDDDDRKLVATRATVDALLRSLGGPS